MRRVRRKITKVEESCKYCTGRTRSEPHPYVDSDPWLRLSTTRRNLEDLNGLSAAPRPAAAATTAITGTLAGPVKAR